MENKQLSTISNNAMMALAIHVSVDQCPVAKRVIQRIPDGIPVKAVEAILKTDPDITTPDQSVQSLEPSVSRFASIYGERTLAAIILSHITLVEDMCNVSRKMEPEAMAVLAKKVTRLLLDDDVSINLADLQIISDRLMRGDAGQVYGGLNGQMVMKAYTDYLGEKANAFADWRERNSARYKSGFYGRSSSSEAMEAAERVKHMAAREAFQNGTLQKDMKEG